MGEYGILMGSKCNLKEIGKMRDFHLKLTVFRECQLIFALETCVLCGISLTIDRSGYSVASTH